MTTMHSLVYAVYIDVKQLLFKRHLFLGCHVGTIITMPLSGLLTKYGFDGGWASVFYCFGK